MIRVVEEGRKRFLYFNATQQSVVDMEHLETPDFEYMDYFLVPPALGIPPREVLFIGLGAGLIPRMYLRRFPTMQATIVEIDPQIPWVAEKYFAFPQDSRLQVIVADGRKYLERADREFDIIVVDAYDAVGAQVRLPPHLADEGFCGLLRAHLRAPGACMQNVVGMAFMPEVGKLRAIWRKCFREVFAFQMRSSMNVVLLGLRGFGLTVEQLKARLRSAPTAWAPRFRSFAEMARQLC